VKDKLAEYLELQETGGTRQRRSCCRARSGGGTSQPEAAILLAGPRSAPMLRGVQLLRCALVHHRQVARTGACNRRHQTEGVWHADC
jgi:hypothetical protein